MGLLRPGAAISKIHHESSFFFREYALNGCFQKWKFAIQNSPYKFRENLAIKFRPLTIIEVIFWMQIQIKD